jgi:16S rRNA processing protein RimM
MTDLDQPRWTWLALIRRPQGRKGEVFADILTDFPEKFDQRRTLWLIPDHDSTNAKTIASPRKVELTNHWPHKGGIVLHFAHSDSISSAEKLAGLIVAIPIEQRAVLAEDEVYIADLIGCELVDIGGAGPIGAGPFGAWPISVGTIQQVDRSAGPVALLVVMRPDSENEILIPFAKSYLRRIDLKGKRVEMALPEGLIELNA